MHSLFRKVLNYQSTEELKATLWATAYGFSIMLSYYILRSVRDEIAAEDRGNLQIIWTAVFLTMTFVAVPAYSWLCSRYSRGVFVPFTNRFFIACLIAFWIALVTLPVGARPWIDRVFYVWSSVFALFVVTVFWGLLADCFNREQGKRLFAFITVGISLGGIAGSAVTVFLAKHVPVFALLLIACVPLEIAAQFAGVLHRKFRLQTEHADEPLLGTAISGMKAVFASPYLLGIAAYISLMTLANTVFYFSQSELVYDAITDRGERRALLASMDLWVNILTTVFQVYIAAYLIRWFGLGKVLAIVPIISIIGFIALGLYPTLAVLVAVQIIYRVGRYGISRGAREVLFTVISREEKYKSKSFIDAAVYRGGDLVTGWMYAGLSAVGLSLGVIAFMAAPIAAVWAMNGLNIGRRCESSKADPKDLPNPNKLAAET